AGSPYRRARDSRASQAGRAAAYGKTQGEQTHVGRRPGTTKSTTRHQRICPPKLADVPNLTRTSLTHPLSGKLLWDVQRRLCWEPVGMPKQFVAVRGDPSFGTVGSFATVLGQSSGMRFRTALRC